MEILKQATDRLMDLRIQSFKAPVNEQQLHEVEMLIFTAMDRLNEFAAIEKEKEAVAFAEWLNANHYSPSDSSDKWTKSYVAYTTSELYNEFKRTNSIIQNV